MRSELEPDFGFDPPRGYGWLRERGLVGYDESPLDPWHYLKREEVFRADVRWPRGPARTPLVAFARRYDNDDIACFALEGGRVRGVTVIHGWTESGYDVLNTYDDFWQWLKSVVDDLAELAGGD